MPDVKITYLGHACFCLESAGYRTVIDPYADNMVPGLPVLRVEAEAVYCSHGHDDHSHVASVALSGSEIPAPYSLKKLEVTHDDAGGKLRGMNTIHVFDFGGLRIAHMGDVGRSLTGEEQSILQELDALLIPVGGYYTIDAATAAEMVSQLKPRVVIPMHYRTDQTGFPAIAHISDFTARFDQVVYGGDSLILTQETEKQIHVLQYK